MGVSCVLGKFEKVQTDDLHALKSAQKLLPLVVRGHESVCCT